MKPLPKNFLFLSVAVSVGIFIGATTLWFYQDRTPQSLPMQGNNNVKNSSKDPQILYWVAPMDPRYQRDKPGKSPMGMDLIPVYGDSSSNTSPGTITINPAVINNLGVRTAHVKRGELKIVVNTVGYVQYDEEYLVHIHPRVEGWIEVLYCKAAGDPVKKDEPLYALYSPTLVNAQEEYLLALKRNNPILIDAAEQRLQALQVPSRDIQRLKQSGRVNQTVTIRAPQSGVIDNLNARQGMFVKPGMEVMSIGVLEQIWVIGEVFERQASLVKLGDAVQLQLDYLPGRVWSGHVDYIYPSLNSKTRTAQVRVHFDNPDAYLRPGMFAQMAIHTSPSEQTLLIPREALIRTGNQARVVLALGEGQFKSIAVEVGQVENELAEIVSGLNEGDRIVTSAHFLIDSESSKTSDFRRMLSNNGATSTSDSSTQESPSNRSAMDHKVMDHKVMDHNTDTKDAVK